MENLVKALTFDDVLLQPAHSTVLPKDTDFSTYVTKGFALKTPLLSAAMDTVTEYELAIAMAQQGGLGIIHKNMSIESQAKQITKVKRFESGTIRDPITVDIDASVEQVLALQKKYQISALPVVKGAKVFGLVTQRDLRFQDDIKTKVTAVMTPQEKLITVKVNTKISVVKSLLQKHRIERVLIVADDFELKGMITVKDIKKSFNYPHASRDALKRLRVGAAVGIGAQSLTRVDALAHAGVDVVVVDTAHGHSQGVLDMVKNIKKKSPGFTGYCWQYCHSRSCH